jgi:hypothetical protein
MPWKYFFFKGQLCLKNAIIFISQNLFIFGLLLQFRYLTYSLAIYDLSFASLALMADGIIKVNKYFVFFF